MARAIALSRQIAERSAATVQVSDIARTVVVLACAAALIAAGQPFPY